MSFNCTLTSETGAFWIGDLTTVCSVADFKVIKVDGINHVPAADLVSMRVDTELLLIPGAKSIQLPSEVLGIIPAHLAYKQNPRYGFVISYSTITIQAREDKFYILNRDVPMSEEPSTPDILLVFRRVNGVFAVVTNHISSLHSVPDAVIAAECLAEWILQAGSRDTRPLTTDQHKELFAKAARNLKTIGRCMKQWESALSESSNMTLVPFREYQVKVTASEAGIVNRTLIVYTNGRPDDRTHINTLFKNKIMGEFGDLSFLGSLIPRLNFSEKGESLVIKARDESKDKDYRLYLTGYRSFVYLPVDILGAIEVKDTVWEA